MSVTLTSPLTGGVQTNTTTPAYTLTTDIAPDVNGKQWAVTALASGTYASLRTHSVSDPSTITVYRPKVPASLPNPNPVTGKYGPIPMNRHSIVVRKGVNFAANQAPLVATARVLIDIPAGSDAYDAANVRALYSYLIGALSQQSAGFGDTAITGIL
jgi:hypothetical protein